MVWLKKKDKGLYCVCILFLKDGRCRSAKVPPLPRRYPVSRQVTVAAELRDACVSPLRNQDTTDHTRDISTEKRINNTHMPSHKVLVQISRSFAFGFFFSELSSVTNSLQHWNC